MTDSASMEAIMARLAELEKQNAARNAQIAELSAKNKKLENDQAKLSAENKKLKSNHAVRGRATQSPVTPRDRRTAVAQRKQMRQVPLQRSFPWQRLTDDQRNTLKNISKVEDAGLQRLLWEIGSTVKLLDHQFGGVRGIAGVSNEFPGAHLVNITDDKQGDMIRAQVLVDAKPRFDGDRGLIMADVMGLGKTIQSICGMELRQAIAAARDDSGSQRPVLICSPNVSVRDQWREELMKSGVNESFIEILRTSSPEGIQRAPLYYLCTRYDLQTEMRRCFKKRYNDSGLFPSATRDLLKRLANQYKSSKGRSKNNYNASRSRDIISVDEIITRLLGNKLRRLVEDDLVFSAVIIDEAVSSIK
jgi:hypothetical protein